MGLCLRPVEELEEVTWLAKTDIALGTVEGDLCSFSLGLALVYIELEQAHGIASSDDNSQSHMMMMMKELWIYKNLLRIKFL